MAVGCVARTIQCWPTQVLDGQSIITRAETHRMPGTFRKAQHASLHPSPSLRAS